MTVKDTIESVIREMGEAMEMAKGLREVYDEHSEDEAVWYLEWKLKYVLKKLDEIA